MEQIALSIATALVLSIMTYLTKLQKGESFDVIKSARTVTIGGILGFIAWQQGIVLSPENWDSYLAANMGIIAFSDQIVKSVGRLFYAKITSSNN